jgi:Trk K+ transport system NAD-binding subunit
MIYERLSPWLGVFERRTRHFREESIGDGRNGSAKAIEVIVLGLGRYGGEIAGFLQQRERKVLGVDFNPELLRFHESQGIPTLYGDVDDAEIFHALPIGTASWIVSSIPDRTHGLALLHSLQHAGYKGRVALTAHNRKEQEVLQAAGADLVLLPFRDAAKEAVDRIVKYPAS